MTITEEESDMLGERTSTDEAIKSLITAKPTLKAQDSEVELKTELSNDEVRGHSMLSILNKFIQMSPAEFSSHCIIGELVDKKERKAWSKDRKSRGEIVTISKHPDMPGNMQGDIRKEGILRRMFSPRRQQQ